MANPARMLTSVSMARICARVAAPMSPVHTRALAELATF